jgi:hypothetical protein
MRVKLQNFKVQNTGTQTITTNSIDYVYLGTTAGIANKNSLLSINNTTVSTTASTVITKTKSGTISNNIMQGIMDSQKESGFSIFPNPASDKEVTINFASANTENYSVNIYSTLGQKMKEINFGSRGAGNYSETIQLTNLSPGIYYMSLKVKNRESVQKLIIE